MAASFSCRCSICNKELKSSTERKTRTCNSCLLKKSNTNATLASVALVAVGATIGFIGGYVASLWSNEQSPKSVKETEPDTSFLDANEDIASCPICYDRRVNICLTPCGHTLCKQCTNELPNSLCPMCSKRISHQQPIYIN